MVTRVGGRWAIEELVRIALPACRAAAEHCRRRGPGRPPVIPEWVIMMLIVVAVANRRRSKSAQYRFLAARRQQLSEWIGTDHFPSRTTYFDRYRRAWLGLQHCIRWEGQRAIQAGWCDAESVAVDQSLVPSRGPPWNERHRRQNALPHGADLDATWTYSAHHGWVLGYGYEVVVSSGKVGAIWPLLASADPASWKPARTFPAKIEALSRRTRFVLADAGYDNNDFAEAWEWDEQQRRTGRRFLCPLIERHRKHPHPRPTHTEHGQRRHRREHRDQRRQYFKTPIARRLFARRAASVEPFNEWLKSLFDLHKRAWHRGLDNNRTQLLAAIFCYQLLLHFNRRHHRSNGQIQWILDIL